LRLKGYYSILRTLTSKSLSIRIQEKVANPLTRFDGEVRGPLGGPCLHLGAKLLRTYVYIDGFNLYYGAVKGTPYKWLNLMAMCQGILEPYHDVLSIKYFTARVRPTQYDQQKHIRQQTYIRALTTYLQNIHIVYGHFLSHVRKAPLANPIPPKFTDDVIVTEEKGSDVNLALHFLDDAWRNHYDCGVIISNDSDLAEAVKLVKCHHKKVIGIINPQVKAKTNNRQLGQYANFIRRIRETILKNSQLPDPIPGTNISKPKTW